MENANNIDLKMQIISDIHLEIKNDRDCKSYPHWPIIPVLSPVLALLGDIGYPNKQTYEDFLLFQADRFQHVLVIAGNHEYYKQKSIGHANMLIEKICSKRNNLHFLNRTTVEINGILFIGTTLWTSIVKARQILSYMCNDYRTIYTDDNMHFKSRVLTVDDTNAFHEVNVRWLQSTISRAKEEKKKVVVLTHHAPTMRNSLIQRDRNVEYNELCYTNLEYLMDKEVVLGWCFGHTHYSSDQVINGVRVATNQHGYCVENLNGRTVDPEYLEDYVIDFAESQEDVMKRARGLYM